MGLNLKLPFGLGRKKDEAPEEERSYREQEDSGNEDGIHMDSSNPFEQAAEEEEKVGNETENDCEAG